MSAWLTIALTIMGLPWLLVSFTMPLMRALPRLQEEGPVAAFRVAHEILNQPSPTWLVAWAVVSQALLVSFTHYSGSPRVREHDKFWVFVVMCFAAVSWLQTIGQWLRF
jgi:hypothetical protein